MDAVHADANVRAASRPVLNRKAAAAAVRANHGVLDLSHCELSAVPTWVFKLTQVRLVDVRALVRRGN